MSINGLEITEMNKNLNNLEVGEALAQRQNSFLNSSLGYAINGAVDVGLRAVLPDLIENEVIDVKNTLLNEGLESGINKAIDTALDFGKSVIGIFTGNFENISQVEKAVEKGGLIDIVSGLINNVVNGAMDKNILSDGIGKLILTGKNLLLGTVSDNITGVYNSQQDVLTNVNTYATNWIEAFNNKDFDKMESNYTNLEESFKELLPLEQIINSVRKIENIHNLIKNNGQNFNLTKEELELAGQL
ncbi:MAG: hypothetical protein LBL91_03180 [Lachnospiraceae bacterium]|jgi:hypothetical protein|nr:hypothetical protein [Lachnospiraceae bacterium]